MAHRVDRKTLEDLVVKLNHKLGRPATHFAVDEDDGVAAYNLGHIFIDHYPAGGGYALREADNQAGGERFYWPRWRRVSASEMSAFLDGQLMILGMYQDLVMPQSTESVD